MNPNELLRIVDSLHREKNIETQIVFQAIEAALVTAARRQFGDDSDIDVHIDPQTGGLQATVDGQRLDEETIGRIGAQTAKQVIIQKIKDAERDNIYDEFKDREGELITGTVKRVSHGNIVVSVGKAEAVIPYREQSPREIFRPGDRVRAILVEVDKSQKGAQVILSRTSAELVRTLFELEVPELYDETIEIRAIAREAGSRTKVAVKSNDINVDPVGACVGMKGARVRSVVEELSGEKIDIVRWSDDAVELCANALNPADILHMQVDAEQGSIQVIVPQDQLSLAIGKRGQNARLASKLIGWNIDIQGETDGPGSDDLDALFDEGDESGEAVEAGGEGDDASGAEVAEVEGAVAGEGPDAIPPESARPAEAGDDAAVASGSGGETGTPASDEQASDTGEHV